MTAAPAHDDGTSRRAFLGASGLAVAAQVIGVPSDALAFENRVGQKDVFALKTKSPTPSGVGEGLKDGKLRPCRPLPNCFTSSPLEEDAKNFYPPFEYEGMGKAEAMATLMEVINGYKPGQRGVDEGGFKVMKATPDYVYVQFESGKRGYTDDFELGIIEDGPEGGRVLVRSSSRIGIVDQGVNAVRINYIVKKLNEYEGWNAKKISKETHPYYVGQNR